MQDHLSSWDNGGKESILNCTELNGFVLPYIVHRLNESNFLNESEN